MRAKVSIHAGAFEGMINSLVSMATNPEATFKSELKNQVGKVIETAVRYTGSAKSTAYPRRNPSATGGTGFAREGESELWVNTTGKGGSPVGRVWLREPGKDGSVKNFIIRGPGQMRHWSNDRWARAQRLLAQADPDPRELTRTKKGITKLRGRGLAKKSWVQIADDLGVMVKVPAYVRNALPQDGKPRASGFGREYHSARGLFFELENRYPILVGRAQRQPRDMNGRAILDRSIRTRLKAFEGDVRRKVFKDVTVRAQRWPGIFVKP